jgi:hypothetical protein
MKQGLAVHIGLAGIWLLFSGSMMAQPSVSSSIMVGDQKLFMDVKKPNLYYHLPFDYALSADATGKPAFTLFQMRYTGTTATGDAGQRKYNNILQFRITIDPKSLKAVAAMKTELKKINPLADIKMLPVKKFSSLLVFAPVEETGNDSINVVKADMVETSDEAVDLNNSFWTERTISVHLSNTDAQLVEEALKAHRSIVSFSYAFFTEFVEKGTTTSGTTSTGGIRPLHRKIAAYYSLQLPAVTDTTMQTSIVKADVIPLAVDIIKWPTLVQKVDINERAPVKYPLFDVYCYDFNQELRADLFEKVLDIKAQSVNGADIISTAIFREDRPDVYAKSIRFPYAIRFDKPFYYRVTEIDHDGERNVSDWKQKTNWNELLDITSPPEKTVLKVKPKEDKP